jgi:hypothetical protein
MIAINRRFTPRIILLAQRSGGSVEANGCKVVETQGSGRTALS